MPNAARAPGSRPKNFSSLTVSKAITAHDMWWWVIAASMSRRARIRSAFLPILPDAIQSPRRDRAAILDGPIQQHPLEVGNRRRANDQIVLLGIQVAVGLREAGSEVNILFLPREAVGDPHRSEIDHGGCDQAGFLPQFAAGQFFRIDVSGFPSALRQFQAALLNRVAELLDQVDRVPLDGDDDRAIVLVDDAVDAARAAAALNLILADAQPGIAVDLTAAEGADAHMVL